MGKDEPEGRVQFNLKMCNHFRGVVTTGGKNCCLQLRIPLRRRRQHVKRKRPPSLAAFP
jgi:hypothetical protein